ncbi:MAG: hypothetical protein Q4G02_02400 [bacterium]|nr:hypothetical protein [bacterium]
MSKKNTILIISIIAVIMVATLFFIFRPKSEEPTTTIIPQLVTPLGNVSTQYSLPVFKGTWPTFPEKLPLLAIEVATIPDLTTKLNDYCQINSQYDYIFIGDVCSYYFYNKNQNVEVTSNIDVDYEYLPIMTKEEADANIQDFLNTFVPDKSALSLANVIYWTGGPELLPANTDDATMIQLEYNYLYNEIPILSKAIGSYSSTFLTNSYNLLQKAEIPTQVLSYTVQGNERQLFSLNQALQNIAEGQAYILLVGNFRANQAAALDEQMDLKSLTQIKFDQVALEYRFDEVNLVAVPTYHFSGQALDKNANQMNVEIITPAIKL